MSRIMMSPGVTVCEVDMSTYISCYNFCLLTFTSVVEELPKGKCAIYANREVREWIRTHPIDQWEIASYEKYPKWGTHCNSRYIITAKLFTLLALRWA